MIDDTKPRLSRTRMADKSNQKLKRNYQGNMVRGVELRQENTIHYKLHCIV